MNGKSILKDKDKPKKERKKTTSQLKKELDKLFSLYVRTKYTNERGEVRCYTCPAIKNVKSIQCGHFISRSYLATRFCEENVRPQCVGCNVFGNGKNVEFARCLEIESGIGTVDSLYKKAQEITIKYPYEEKIQEYKEKLKQYENTTD